MLYNTARRVLFAMNPEMAHSVTMANLDWIVHMGLHKLVSYVPDDDPVTVMGVRFPNAIGLAAGMDKDGTRVSAFGGLGFGHVEVGTITPLAQPGNPKPRLFRLIPAGGIINRMGFNNQGVEQVLKNLRSADGFRLRGGVLGINIGKNAVTPIENALSDYEKCLDAVYDHADYIAVNISSPNTKNLRTLQGEEELEKLVAGICARREVLKEARHGKHVPIAVKLAPDLENDDILRCVDTLMLHASTASSPPTRRSPVRRSKASSTPKKRAVCPALRFANARPRSFVSSPSTSRASFPSSLRAASCPRPTRWKRWRRVRASCSSSRASSTKVPSSSPTA